MSEKNQTAVVLGASLKPERVIFNPGAENTELETTLTSNGIKIVHACTLVLLRMGQFQKA